MRMRRAVRVTGWTMIWSGLFVLGFAGYQLFVTDLINARSQAQAQVQLVEALAQRRQELPVPTTLVVATTVADAPKPDPIVHHPEEAPAEGLPMGTFRIPKIDVDEVLISGVTTASLKLGPGFMPWTSVPGQPGNAVISGHRTTYGRPFFRLDELVPGDTIEIETAIGLHIYTVRETRIVAPTDVWVTNERRGAWLTLTTCNPRYSARERLVVFAELTSGPNLEYARYLEENELQDLS